MYDLGDFQPADFSLDNAGAKKNRQVSSYRWPIGCKEREGRRPEGEADGPGQGKAFILGSRRARGLDLGLELNRNFRVADG